MSLWASHGFDLSFSVTKLSGVCIIRLDVERRRIPWLHCTDLDVPCPQGPYVPAARLPPLRGIPCSPRAERSTASQARRQHPSASAHGSPLEWPNSSSLTVIDKRPVLREPHPPEGDVVRCECRPQTTRWVTKIGAPLLSRGHRYAERPRSGNGEWVCKSRRTAGHS